MAFCIKCGSEYQEGQKFCIRCGAEIQPIRPVQPAVPANPVPVSPADSTPKRKTNGLCTAGFILSLLGMFLLGVTSLFGLILSILGLGSAKKKQQPGSGKAVAGIIMSSAMILLVLLIGILLRNPIMDLYEQATGRTFPTRMVSVKYENMVAESGWVIREDETCLQLNPKDRTFKSFVSYIETSDVYLTGHYTMYNGKKAVEYLTKKAGNLRLSEDDIEDLFDSDKGHDESNLIALVCDYESFVYDGKTQKLEKQTRRFYGFYVLITADEQVFDAIEMVNLDADSSFTLIKEDQYDDYIYAVLSEMQAE